MSIIQLSDDIDAILIIYNIGKRVQAPSRVIAADSEFLSL